MSKLEDLVHKHSFKKKPIYIELHDYSYKHQPLQHNDESFIGRNSIIDKIRSFISESESKSGAYLISGFRGMGKTSVIDKVFEIYQSKSSFINFALLFFFSLVQLFSYPLGDQSKSIYLYNFIIDSFMTLGGGAIFLLVYTVACFFYLVSKHSASGYKNRFWLFFDILLNNPFQKSKFQFCNILRSTVSLIIYFVVLILIHSLISPTTTYDIFWINILFTLFIFFAYDRLKIDFNDKPYLPISYTAVAIVFLFFLNLYFLVYFYKQEYFILGVIFISPFLLYKLFMTGHRQLKGERTNAYKGPLHRIRPYFEFRKHLIVNVNLGKDILNEKDVLKYTASNLLKEYMKWRKSYENKICVL